MFHYFTGSTVPYLKKCEGYKKNTLKVKNDRLANWEEYSITMSKTQEWSSS